MPFRRTRSLTSCLLLAVPLLSGCGGGRIETVESDLNDIKRQVAKLQRQQEEQAEALKAMGQDVEQMRKVSAKVSSETESLSGSVDSLTERLNETNGRLDKLSARLGAGSSAGEPGGSAAIPLPGQPSSSNAGATPEQMYDAAQSDFTKGNYSLALLEYQEFVQQFPDNDLADNAQLGIAECYFAQKRYEDAIREYDKIFSKHPKSDRISAAYLKKGFAFLELGQTAQGVVQLQYLIAKFPKSDEAQVARRRLESMGLKPR